MIGNADDVIIHGKDDEHDRCLYKLIKVACEYGPVCSGGGKCAVKQASVTFFGCVFDNDGTHADPGKVSAVHNIPSPGKPTQLKNFLRRFIYLSPFVPSFSYFNAPLHELFKKGTEFTWNESYQEYSGTVKCLVFTETAL